MRRWSVWAVLSFFVCLGLGPVTVWAEEEGWEAEAAKIHTADCNPVDPGVFEIFLGFEPSSADLYRDGEGVSRERGGAIRDNHYILGVTRGMGPRWDLSASLGYDDCDDDAIEESILGLDDLSLGGKWKVLDRTGFGMAILPSLVLPTGTHDNHRHSGTTQLYYSGGLGAVAVLSGRRWTFNVDANYILPFGSERKDSRGSFASNLALGFQPLSWFQPQVEMNYAVDTVRDGENARVLSTTLGFLFPTEKWGRFQLGVQPTLWGRWADKSTGFHFAWVKGIP
jgi:hypothetical protein